MFLRLLSVIIFSLLSGSCFSPNVNLQKVIIESSDQQTFEELKNELSQQKELPIGELVMKVGEYFLEAPYTSHTLENGDDEKLVVNLGTFDCTTFVENCLAIARSIKSEKTDLDSFIKELEFIRYRNGIRNHYSSRLHYFTEWISNNVKKGIVDDSINKYGSEYNNKVDFMSKHSESYEVLKQFPLLVDTIRQIEENISSKKYYYIPKDKIDSLEYLLNPGDIFGITTSIEGLDIIHTGILIKQNGHFHILHASQSKKKVVISEETLSDFLKPGKRNTGVMIARPVFNKRN